MLVVDVFPSYRMPLKVTWLISGFLLFLCECRVFVSAALFVPLKLIHFFMSSFGAWTCNFDILRQIFALKPWYLPSGRCAFVTPLLVANNVKIYLWQSCTDIACYLSVVIYTDANISTISQYWLIYIHDLEIIYHIVVHACFIQPKT